MAYFLCISKTDTAVVQPQKWTAQEIGKSKQHDLMCLSDFTLPEPKSASYTRKHFMQKVFEIVLYSRPSCSKTCPLILEESTKCFAPTFISMLHIPACPGKGDANF